MFLGVRKASLVDLIIKPANIAECQAVPTQVHVFNISWLTHGVDLGLGQLYYSPLFKRRSGPIDQYRTVKNAVGSAPLIADNRTGHSLNLAADQKLVIFEKPV